MLPAARMTSRRWAANSATMGVLDAALRAFCSANIGVSATLSRTYKAMTTSTVLNRNGSRQAQSRNARLVSPIVELTIRNTKTAHHQPTADAHLSEHAVAATGGRRCVLGGQQS